jgi:hypothetical protein
MSKIIPYETKKDLEMGVAVGEEGDCIALYMDMKKTDAKSNAHNGQNIKIR